MIKIAIFDDDKQRLKALGHLMITSGLATCVGAFSHLRNAVTDVRSCGPDVVLLDIGMPDIDGVTGAAILRHEFPELKIVMQTVIEDDDRIFAAICAGADGYFLKQTTFLKLMDGINDVINGGSAMSPSVARKVLGLVGSRPKYRSRIDPGLSERELEVLRLMVAGLSHKMIADELSISLHTVNSHVHHIYQKLQVHSIASAVSLALKEGLV